jgi:hypothetical protein
MILALKQSSHYLYQIPNGSNFEQILSDLSF